MWELYPGTRRDLWELGPHGTIAQEGVYVTTVSALVRGSMVVTDPDPCFPPNNTQALRGCGLLG